MRLGRPSSLTVEGRNRILAHTSDAREMRDTLTRFCGGSVYAHEDSLRQGYLTLPSGARLGIVGEGVGGDLSGVRGVTALALRIPRYVVGVAEGAETLWRSRGGQGGILVIAPPGGGKTTFLKDLTVRLSGGREPLRVAVVDTRGELAPTSRGPLADVLVGYPRAQGLEIALRVLNPQVLVCDEIGPSDTEAIRQIARAGVPLMASTHGVGLADVRRRTGIGDFIAQGIFSLAVSIARGGGGFQARTEVIA